MPSSKWVIDLLNASKEPVFSNVFILSSGNEVSPEAIHDRVSTTHNTRSQISIREQSVSSTRR
eukprot:1289059-Pyramimonas_sp.AAC.2